MQTFSPMVTPLENSSTSANPSSLIRIGLEIVARRWEGSIGWLVVIRLTLDQSLRLPMKYRASVHKGAGVINEYVSIDLNALSKIRIKGESKRNSSSTFLPDQAAKHSTNFSYIIGLLRY